MGHNLLIHSMAEFSSITLPILEAIEAQCICEIGAEHGGNSKLLHDWLSKRNGKLISIDPSPSAEFIDWLKQTNNIVTHVPKISLEALCEMQPVDAWFIDGDHNWYTVFHELTAIRTLMRRENKPLLVFLHDVCWPCARRDLYYAPERIPASFRHAFTYDYGIVPGAPGVIKGGFRGEGFFACALQEGGERNGVLTAVEDFISIYQQEFSFVLVPAVFGLGVLFDANHPKADLLNNILKPFDNNSLLAKLEENRLANYLTVIAWQDKQLHNGMEGV